MSDERFEYEGGVRLLCQEGGFADASISLEDLPGEPKDVTHKFAAAMGEDIGQSLADALRQRFHVEDLALGDADLGRLRITVERVPS